MRLPCVLLITLAANICASQTKPAPKQAGPLWQGDFDVSPQSAILSDEFVSVADEALAAIEHTRMYATSIQDTDLLKIKTEAVEKIAFDPQSTLGEYTVALVLGMLPIAVLIDEGRAEDLTNARKLMASAGDCIVALHSILDAHRVTQLIPACEPIRYPPRKPTHAAHH